MSSMNSAEATKWQEDTNGSAPDGDHHHIYFQRHLSPKTKSSSKKLSTLPLLDSEILLQMSFTSWSAGFLDLLEVILVEWGALLQREGLLAAMELQ